MVEIILMVPRLFRRYSGVRLVGGQVIDRK